MGLPWAANATANTELHNYLYFIITTSGLLGNYLEKEKMKQYQVSFNQC
jgi:hypothetical protein